jgi:hypothetical protein
MTQLHTPEDENAEAAAGEHLDDIGEELGCARLTGEGNDIFGLRLLDYLEEMVSELRATQDSVRELIT